MLQCRGRCPTFKSSHPFTFAARASVRNVVRYKSFDAINSRQAASQSQYKNSNGVVAANHDRKSAHGKDKSRQVQAAPERQISKQEQRKADWTIIKEMARYLWPKVREGVES